MPCFSVVPFLNLIPRKAFIKGDVTLVIAVRCKDGAAVLADRRSRIIEKGATRFDDDYGKIVRSKEALIYNHGYNRIGDRDWKLRGLELTDQEDHPLYESVSKEMLKKVDKLSAYVFVKPHAFSEVTIRAGEKAKLHRFEAKVDRLVSGTGKDFVDLSPLSDLGKRSMRETVELLEYVFRLACKRLAEKGEDHFSPAYNVETIR